MKRKILCPECRGSGEQESDGDYIGTCENCDGTGKIEEFSENATVA